MADSVGGGGGGGGGDEHAGNQAVPLAPWECLKDAMSPLQCGKAFYFDTRGDLTLRVGKDEAAYEFVVCSRTLGRSSIVFQAMLFGGFAESKPSHGAWTVQLPEDLPSPTFLVLSIIHGYFEHVPGALTVDELYLVLAMTEKYDMTKISRPWASIWFNPYKKTSLTANNDMLLWISWELGQKDVFCRLANDLVRMVSISAEGELLGSDKVPLSTLPCLRPPGILESIARARSNLIQKMTALLYSTTQRLYTAPVCKGTPRYHCSTCGHDTGTAVKLDWCERCAIYTPAQRSFQLPQSLCGNLVFGSVSKAITGIGLQKVALLDTPTPEYRGSVKKLAHDIQNMTIELPGEHKACSPLSALKQKAKKLVKDAVFPVTDVHLQYLENQAKKIGI